jgi:hypothetical protein
VLDVLVEVLVLEDDDWVELGTVEVKLELEVLVVTDEDDWVDVWDELWDEIWDELWLLEDEPPWLLVPTPPTETHGRAVVVVVEPNGIVRTVEHVVVVWNELWELAEPVTKKKYAPAATATRRIATTATAIGAIPLLPSTNKIT